MARSWWLVVVLAAAACKGGASDADRAQVQPAARTPEPPPKPATARREPVPAGSPVAGSAVMRFAIYFTPKPTRDPRAELARLVSREMHPPLAIDPDPAVGSYLQVSSPPIADFAPPAPSLLEHFGRGLSAQQVSAVQQSREVIVIKFVADGTRLREVHLAAMKVMEQLALRCGGLLWDEDTRELFTGEAWRDRMRRAGVAPLHAPALFTIHSYRDGELVRMVTLGLAKLGLPDLVVAEVAPDSTTEMATLINLVAQTMADGAVVREGGLIDVDSASVPDKAGGPSYAGVRMALAMVVATPDEGDADNRLWEIAFPGGPASELQERQDAVVSQLFGTRDEITPVEHDEEMMETSRRARARLLSVIKKQVQKPSWLDLNHLMVKAPFRTDDGGNEWMWMDVLRWKGATIDGILQNEPAAVSGLKAGARVSVAEDSVFDYTLRRADGSQEGNTTGAIMEQREKQQR